MDRLERGTTGVSAEERTGAPEPPRRNRAEGMVGLALMGGYAAGALALITGLFAVLDRNIVGAGVCFLAAGTAFGLAANALLRK